MNTKNSIIVPSITLVLFFCLMAKPVLAQTDELPFLTQAVVATTTCLQDGSSSICTNEFLEENDDQAESLILGIGALLLIAGYFLTRYI